MTKPSETWIGKPVERNEDARFLTGRGCFVDDFKLPGMCHAMIVRSRVACGRIRRIDSGAANALPGVIRVLTYEDIAEFASPIPVRVGPLPGLERYLQRPLARDRVRYVGEPLAVVIAADRYIAEDAGDLIDVDIEESAAVTGIDDALAGSVLV
ncbi:MAG: xanthine dehydrogenase family protein molybdopterin-binding subunit, partial [Burkholderiales bacterium]|nr:xanthine dehydrogenase family protein molybdopterin-binding subunit [Burkholderiales bacterium]